jgi:hypothetical protein
VAADFVNQAKRLAVNGFRVQGDEIGPGCASWLM